ncbi:MAG: hypothetical protein U1G07_08410 [Verrucomicrobiota bacterium]
MQTILICPGDRPAVGYLAQSLPLVVLPVLGESLIALWIRSLAENGVKAALVHATDRPELVRRELGDGSRWGVSVEVRAELTEFSVAEARQRQAQAGSPDGRSASDVYMVDHLPGLPQSHLFQSYRTWFTSLLSWMPLAAQSKPIGLREIRPQIWCGRRVQLAPTAHLQAPCWIGDHVQIGPHAQIGPGAVLEHGAVVDQAAEVEASIIGPDTFVGSLTRVAHSIACGNTLIDWETGSCTQVPDPFLLCSLGPRALTDGQDRSQEHSGRRWWNLWRRPWERLIAAAAKPK